MNILKWFLTSLPGLGINEPVDLETWRNWFGKITIIFGVIIIPISMIPTFPTFIADKNYTLIVLDSVIWLVSVGLLFWQAESYRVNAFLFMAVLYTLMVSFFIELGPFHARPAWLVVCAVIASLMFGTRGAISATAVNMILLFMIRWLVGPGNPGWTYEYQIPYLKWVMFVVNVSIITLGACLLVGFLLEKLDKSLKHERDTQKELSAERDRLKSINRKLHHEIEQRVHTEEERKKLELQLNQVQKMEAIGTLAGGIAHDFNNILQSILVNTELSLYEYAGGNFQPGRLREVLKSSERATDLVNQILTFSRQSERELRPLQLSPVVKETLKLLRSTIPTTIEMRQYITTEQDYVLADPTEIHQVLMNLCTNAAQSMREKGGFLEVRLENESVSAGQVAPAPDLHPGEYVRLTVKDSGHGMPPETIERIFEPFFTTKKRGEGTGMGLAVVHGIVRSYGGAVTVHSKVGEGTTFDLFFRRIDRPSPARVETQKPLPRGTERILIVDDEVNIIDLLRDILEKLGYEVTTRGSSINALEAFRPNPDHFDLVITDQTMPHMSGRDLAGELLKIRPDIPIILCTGFSDMISEDDAKAMGIKEFVMKPIVMRDLADTVRKVLDE